MCVFYNSFFFFCFYHFSFSAFKLFSNLTDLIGAVRLICTFRSFCDECILDDFSVVFVFVTIFRKYLLSPRCIDSLTIFAAIGCCHSPWIRPPSSSPLIIIAESWCTDRVAVTRPIDVAFIVVCMHLLADFWEFASNKIFLPITVFDMGRFGNDGGDDGDDDNIVFDA